MKTALRYVLIGIAFFNLSLLSSCFDEPEPRPLTQDEQLIADAKRYFEEGVLTQQATAGSKQEKRSFRGFMEKTPQWQRAYIKQLSIGRGVAVPIKFLKPLYTKSPDDGTGIAINDVSYLLVYRDVAGTMHSEVVTSLPDENYLNSSDVTVAFSGVVMVEDWFGKFVKGYRYKDGTIRDLTTDVPASQAKMVANCTVTDWYTCASIDGGSTWECYYDYTETVCEYSGGGGSGGGGGGGGTGGGDYGGGRGGSGGSGNPPASVRVGGPPTALRINNRNQYFNCFSRTSPARLTIYSDQPVANSNAAYSGSDVGHSWFSISQTINGQTITRVFGYYPTGAVTPLNPSDPGVLVNDSGHGYDVSVSFAISASELNQILTSATTQFPNTYNLNNNNCTDFVVDACGRAGLTLPQIPGSWPGGSGLTPGQFGQNLRTLDLANKIETRDLDGGTAPANSGDCLPIVVD